MRKRIPEYKTMSNPEKSDNRRLFLIGGMRALLLGGIVFAGGLLGRREIRSSGDETVCAFELPCGNCEKRAGCTDPKAMKSKQDIQIKQ